jgi:serine/threonine protein kinase
MTTAPLRFGTWLLLRRLGTGGMAEVWQAVAANDPDGPQVAVKRLLPPLLGDPHGMALFASEVAVLARLNHPAIPALLASGQDAGLPWLAMPDLGGVHFGTLLAQRGTGAAAKLASTTAWNQAVALLAADLWDALQAAHAAGVVHCDVSPTNVVVRPDGAVFLVDFGIASWHATPPQQVLRGKRPYLAPELWHGHPPSAAADAWALVAMVVEAVTGQRPKAADPLQIDASPTGANPGLAALVGSIPAQVPGIDKDLWQLLGRIWYADAPARLRLLPKLGPALRKVCAGKPAIRARVTLSACVRLASSGQVAAPAPATWTKAAEERGEPVTSPLQDHDATQVHELQMHTCLDGASCAG